MISFRPLHVNLWVIIFVIQIRIVTFIIKTSKAINKENNLNNNEWLVATLTA